MNKLNSWWTLWADYPDYQNFPDSDEVKKEIGGEVTQSWLGKNSCAIRLSATLNKNGFRIPGNFPGLLTVRGGDGARYAIRVAEMRKWLEFTLGRPDLDHRKKAGTAFDKAPLGAAKGIIAFDIRWSDATGHLDLWNGVEFSSEYRTTSSYWTLASRVTLWTAKV